MLTVSQKEGAHGTLLVIIDSDILGKKFKEGRVQLDLTKDFYKGEHKTDAEVKVMMRKAHYLHLTGKAAVALGIELDLVESKKILYVQKVPHAQVVVGS